MKILIVGGTFNDNGIYGTESDTVSKMIEAIKNYVPYQENEDVLDYINGGKATQLPAIMNMAKEGEYDIIFWMPKTKGIIMSRDIKSMVPTAMLVVSEENDENYGFDVSVKKALELKANLVFEYKEDMIMVYDPLGCVWYEGDNVNDATLAAMNRLYYLASITRQSTTQSAIDKSLVLNWYFDRFKQDMYESNKTIQVPKEAEDFVALIHTYAEIFHELMGENNIPAEIKKIRPPQVGRCSKGMPSFKLGDTIFVSKRAVNNEYLELQDFVPVYSEDDKIYYCGDEKPAVDTPVHVKIYEALPNIKYILHSHCYVKNAPFTTKSIPCGAIEEVDEVLHVIDKFGSRTENKYQINLYGHGSFILGATLDDMKSAEYEKRPMPERI